MGSADSEFGLKTESNLGSADSEFGLKTESNLGSADSEFGLRTESNEVRQTRSSDLRLGPT